MERTAGKKVVKNSGSRSRTGCITCKVRRVKCDEGKPGCQRCKKFGRLCDGYKRKSTSPQPKQRTASPQMETNWASLTMLAPKPLRTLSSIAFNDEQEASYFQIFQGEIINNLTDDRESPLWHGIIRQACFEESSLFHCAIAIAALDRACKARASQSSLHFEFHHRHALQQYGYSLKELRKVIARGDSCIRTTLIASLLIFCFQNFHGDIRMALNNARTTIDLMYNWISTQANPSTRIGYSPVPNVVENELVETFTRLDWQLVNWVGVSKTSYEFISLLSSQSSKSLPIPSMFNSVKEAGTVLDNLKSELFMDRISDRITPLAAIIPPCSISETLSFNEPPFSNGLRAWGSAFQPLFDLSRARLDRDPNDESGFIPAGILRSHCSTLRILFWSSYYGQKHLIAANSTNSYPSPTSVPSSPTSSDTENEKRIHNLILPEYREITTVCRAIVNHPAFIKSFIFGGGIIPPLFLVVCRCQDLTLRREAIQILKDSKGRREGVWDAKTMARIGEEILRCEALDDHVREYHDGFANRDFEHVRSDNSLFNSAKPCDCGCKEGRDAIMLQQPINWVNVQVVGMGMKIKLPLVRQQVIRSFEDRREDSGNMSGDEVEEMHLLDWVEQFLHPLGVKT